jgi:hypothetical protein
MWAAQSRNRLGPAGGFEYLYVSYDPCSDGVPSAGCLARVLSATRGHLSQSFPKNFFCKTQEVFARKKYRICFFNSSRFWDTPGGLV